MDTRMDIGGWLHGWIAMRIKIHVVHVRSKRFNGFLPLDRLLVFIDMYRICSGARDGINIYFDFKNIWAQI